MTRFRFYTATTLDGFIADDHDSLDWLLSQPLDEGGALNYTDFISDIGTIVMGATTYQWILDNHDVTGEGWPYTQPTWVFTHRDLAPASADVHVVAGAPAQFRETLTQAAGQKDVWIVGGGDLAAQFAAAGMLDEVVVWFAPVLLGSGRPLFTSAYDLTLREFGRNEAFLGARYDVVAPRG